MAKLPWMAFFVSDHLTDTRPLTAASRGIWMDCNCHLWRSPTPGTLAFSHGEWARLIGVTVEEFRAALNEFRAFSICDIEEDGKGSVRVSSRRMLRDEKARQSNAEHQRRHRHKDKVRDLSGESKRDSHSHNQNHNQNHSQGETPPSPPEGGQSEAHALRGKAPESNSENSAPIELIVRSWNIWQILQPFQCEPGKNTRRRIEKLWREHSELRWFQDYFGRIARSPELTGSLDSGWCASLTWALEQNNIEKVMCGSYRERPSIEEED